MKCFVCKNRIKYITSFQRKRNNKFYCSRKCYLKYIRRNKIYNFDFFDNIDTEEKVYWLGFIYADGNVNKNGKVIQINLSAKDSDHLEKFANIFKKNVKISSYFSKGKVREFARIVLSNEHMHNSLTSIGVLPNKTFTANEYIFSCVPDLLLRHFIRGYFDGDGCISVCPDKNKYNISFVGTERFISFLKKIIVRELGFFDVKIKKNGKVYVISWCGREICSIFSSWLYKDANIFLERKKNIFESIYKDINIRGSSRYRGVSWNKRDEKWHSSISNNKKRINLGYYDNEKEAALAYNNAVLKYNKPKYKMNLSIH